MQPKRNPDSTLFHLPGGRFVVAQEGDTPGTREVRTDVGFGAPGRLVERGLSRAAAETLAHGVRLVRLAELDAEGA